MKEDAAKRMDMTIMRDESETVYVFKLSKFTRNVEVGWYPENGFGFCMLP